MSNAVLCKALGDVIVQMRKPGFFYFFMVFLWFLYF